MNSMASNKTSVQVKQELIDSNPAHLSESLSSNSDTDSSSFETDTVNALLPPGFLDPLPKHQTSISIESSGGVAVETSKAVPVLDSSKGPDSLPLSKLSKKGSCSSGGKALSKLEDKARITIGHSNGKDDGKTLRKRPTNAGGCFVDEIRNIDTQKVAARKRANDSSSASPEMPRRDNSSSKRIKTVRTSGSTTFSGSKASYVMQDDDDDDKEEASDDGGPRIKDLILSYKFHVAHQLWNGVDRGMLTFHSRSATLKSWKIDNADTLEIIAASGLGHLPDIMYEQLDEPLLCAFAERWYPETNSFHMPWGEMSLCLHDTSFILGIPVAGQAIIPKCDGDTNEVFKMLKNVLGYSSTTEELKVEINWNGGGAKQSLMRGFVDRERVRASRKARVYLWWVITSTLFVDRSRTHGQASFIQLLRKPTEASQYAWGAGALAHLYRELGMTSRSDCKQMAGCLTLLQAWIYAYFPCLRPQMRRSWTPAEPHARRWIPRSIRTDLAAESLKEYRMLLDGLTADSVDWLPFGHNPVSVVPISSFSGVIHCRSTTEAYMPDRCARQFGLAQGIPHSPLPPKKAVRTTNPREYRVEHDSAIWVFEKGLQNNTFHEFKIASVASDCSPDYMNWYTLRSHPWLLNKKFSPISVPFGFDSYQAMQRMSRSLVSYHRETYEGTIAPESDDLRSLAESCDHMMPHLSINRRRGHH